MSELNKNESNLVAITISQLFDGIDVIDVQEDVYDADAERLLIKRGTTISAGEKDKIRKLNMGMDTIYVSGNTYRSVLERNPPPEPESRQENEKTTGYASAKDETFELLDEIAKNKVVKQEALLSVSAELSNRLEVTSPSKILSLINALAPVDEYLQRHCVNVSLLNGLMGRWLGYTKNEIDMLVLTGLLHDCGKALVPPQILNAPRRLTIVEFEVMKMHPIYTYDLLSEFPEEVRRASRCHHEKVSGVGYPDGVSGGKLQIEARITAVSDIYDAIVSQRAYKKPQSPFSVMAMLIKLKDIELDAELVETFIQNMPQELIGKQVMMSDGVVGIVRVFDPGDIGFPMIEVGGRILKSGEHWFCTSMHTED